MVIMNSITGEEANEGSRGTQQGSHRMSESPVTKEKEAEHQRGQSVLG